MKLLNLLLAASLLSPSSANLRASSPTSPSAADAFAETLRRSLWTTNDGICGTGELVTSTSGDAGVTGVRAECGKCAAHQNGQSTQCNGQFATQSKTCSTSSGTTTSKKHYTGCCANMGSRMIGEPSESSCSLTCSSSSSSTNLANNAGDCVYYGKALKDGPSKSAAMANGTSACAEICGEGQVAEYIDNGHAEKEHFSSCCACMGNTCYDALKAGAGDEAYISRGGRREVGFLGVVGVAVAAWVW
ncbi:hypothetical protein TL16_g11465 [Triparma laevis f. inornata]|uniref:Uncharacterized protein n=1 Tax=Triparma laevis f. inornata TaxID=1714386 RepID=A0A9W7BEU2_9STRA|nr:hypothetical protein TL16_g11465 [Triparma laevis f. inornata]